ncbi:hypothetical protein KTH89_23490, partial [Lachnospiraceae bacterium ASD5720]|nr:hypothetical protein [Diplocloster agilis]
MGKPAASVRGPRPVSGENSQEGEFRAAGLFGVSPGAHRAAARPLSGIEKPGSGCTADFTSDGQEPLNREHITCSW